jgi:hypothetical protein
MIKKNVAQYYLKHLFNICHETQKGRNNIMALNNTETQMKGLLAEITHDLEKADRGNKAASQRVRTGTIKLEKVAKVYL